MVKEIIYLLMVDYHYWDNKVITDIINGYKSLEKAKEDLEFWRRSTKKESGINVQYWIKDILIK